MQLPDTLSSVISKDLIDGPLQRIDYQDADRAVSGYDASNPSAICSVWLEAREKEALEAQQLGKAQKAELLIRALAETGILWSDTGREWRVLPYGQVASVEAVESHLRQNWLPVSRKDGSCLYISSIRGKRKQFEELRTAVITAMDATAPRLTAPSLSTSFQFRLRADS